MEHSKNSTNKINDVVQTNEPLHSVDTPGGEIDVRELLSVIWRGKLVIIIVTALFAVGAVIYAINQPNIYKSEALLAPAEQSGGGGLASLAGQFGGLASLAGVNLGGGSDKTQLAIEVLKSRKFTADFIKKHNILPQLMAAESWDMQTNKIAYNEALFDSQNNEWLRVVEPPLKPEPSMQEAYRYFGEAMNISIDKKTGMVTLSIQHISPFVAQRWVNWLIEDINQTMKEREVEEAKRSTEFLQLQLNQTEIADIREVLYKLIEEQTKTIMFAKVRDEYVFKTIDYALVPEQKIKPKRALIAVLGTMLGGMLSMVVLLIIHLARKNKIHAPSY